MSLIPVLLDGMLLGSIGQFKQCCVLCSFEYGGMPLKDFEQRSDVVLPQKNVTGSVVG